MDMLKMAGPDQGEVTIRFPADGYGIAHGATSNQFICIYRDMLGILRVDMHDPDDEMVALLDEQQILAGYIPIEP